MSTQQDALRNVRACLERINNEESAIVDTLWYSNTETLFDYIDAALASQPAEAPAGQEPTGVHWSAGRAEFVKYAKRYEDATTADDASVVADIAPTAIYQAMAAQPVQAPAVPTVEEVEAEVGMGSVAWDCVQAESIIRAVLKCAGIKVAPAVPEGWVFMRHPSRFNGQWIPARVWEEDGVKLYMPWEENGSDLEWDQRSEEWEVLAAAPTAQPKQESEE